MNYLIVMPVMTQIKEQSYFFPIGMAYVSSSLKQYGKKVFTYNLNYKDGTVKENLEKIIIENNIDVIATGGLTAQYWSLIEILRAAREVKPDIITWVGGGIITSAPQTAMEALEIVDYGMIGEGEITICELADAVEGLRDIHSVDGIIFKENGEWVITNKRAEIMDLDALPYPDYDGFDFADTLDKTYTDIYALNNGRFATLSFGRSCPFRCTFCFHPSGTKYRKRSMDSVFKELDYLIEKYNIKNVMITDELFVKKMEDAREFCHRIKERNLGFTISLRVDMVTPEMLTLLRDSGCLEIGFGLESADNTILKSMNKHITIEQIEYALALCKEIGINFTGNFIFGDQNETMETVTNTLNWWKEHPEYRINLRLILLYPGCELYHVAIANGKIKDPVQFIKDGCPFTNISKLTDQEYRDVALLTSVLQQKRTDFLKDTEIKYTGFGKVSFTGRCPKCGKMNTWKHQDPFRTFLNVACEHCHNTLNVLAADYINGEVENNYKKLSQHNIGIWGMINAVSEFLDKCPSALGENTFLIDSSVMKQGGQYLGKTVYSPKIIEEKDIETVFVTVTTTVSAEIINIIKTEHPTVKNIFLLGDLLDEDFHID